MRTQDEIYALISKAMYDTMYSEWAKLSDEEKDAYRLNMHGLEMYVSKKKPSTVGVMRGLTPASDMLTNPSEQKDEAL